MDRPPEGALHKFGAEEAAERDGRLAEWYRRLRETTNDAFFPLYRDEHRFLVLKGGGGSGKSVFAARKLVERAVCEPGHRFLVCRKVGRTLRESCYRQIVETVDEFYPEIGCGRSVTAMNVTFPNGSEILFAGLDDVEKLKSIYGITGVWVEEASELLESDLNQLNIRLRGETPFYKQIILTFNPVSVRHWLKRRFFDREDPDVRTHESTYRDNRFVDDEYCGQLERMRESDGYFYEVYALGVWGTAGRSVFNAAEITKRLGAAEAPARKGVFIYTDDGRGLRDIRFEECGDGFVFIYREPEPGVPYVLGGDTAGEGSDSFCVQVLDNRSGEQVCVLHRQQMDEDVFARQTFCLGRFYNDGLIGLETNFSTYPTLELERLGYPRLYVRESVDDYTHAPKHSYGVITTSRTRPVMLAGLIRAAREDIGIVRDAGTLEEMLSFVRGEDGRAAAEVGAHDDRVMALAIAHFIRPQQSGDVLPEQGGTARWTDSMWEDWYAASREERRLLRERWGAPSPRGK